MSIEEISPNVRSELVRLCRDSKKRSSEFSRTHPTRWSPGAVKDPDNADGHCFTPYTAWEYIADRLEGGEPVEILILDKPPGKKGYVLKILQSDKQTLYIKLQLSQPGVLGRSFHYSL
jgi:hypothetical protein